MHDIPNSVLFGTMPESRVLPYEPSQKRAKPLRSMTSIVMEHFRHRPHEGKTILAVYGGRKLNRLRSKFQAFFSVGAYQNCVLDICPKSMALLWPPRSFASPASEKPVLFEQCFDILELSGADFYGNHPSLYKYAPTPCARASVKIKSIRPAIKCCKRIMLTHFARQTGNLSMGNIRRI